MSLAIDVALMLIALVGAATARWWPQGRKLDFSWAGQNCSILFTDIAGFGALSRDDRDRQVIRAAMYDILKSAFREAGLPWFGCYHEDRGDGVLLIIPPTSPTRMLVEPLLGRLAEGLRRHNQQAAAPTRIQLRVALHVGPVMPDEEGVSGESIIHTARLLEAPVLKQELARVGADLGFVASSFVYDTVVKHRPGNVDPGEYRLVEVAVKESRFAAWMYLSGTRDSHKPESDPCTFAEVQAQPVAGST